MRAHEQRRDALLVGAMLAGGMAALMAALRVLGRAMGVA